MDDQLSKEAIEAEALICDALWRVKSVRGDAEWPRDTLQAIIRSACEKAYAAGTKYGYRAAQEESRSDSVPGSEPEIAQLARKAAEQIGKATGCSSIEWEESIAPIIQSAIDKATKELAQVADRISAENLELRRAEQWAEWQGEDAEGEKERQDNKRDIADYQTERWQRRAAEAAGSCPSDSEQEWTRDWVLRNISGLLPDEAVVKLITAHNASRAANLEEIAIIERSRDAWKSQVTNLSEALAAERDRTLLEVSQDRTAAGQASKVEQIALGLKQELAAEREERERTERCEVCNSELSQCGPQGIDGEPSPDCQVCKLRELLAAKREKREQAERDALTPIAQTLDDDDVYTDGELGVSVIRSEALKQFRRQLDAALDGWAREVQRADDAEAACGENCKTIAKLTKELAAAADALEEIENDKSAGPIRGIARAALAAIAEIGERIE